MLNNKLDSSHYIVMLLMAIVCVCLFSIGYGRGRNSAWYESQRALSYRIDNSLQLVGNGAEDNIDMSFGDNVYSVTKIDSGILLILKNHSNK